MPGLAPALTTSPWIRAAFLPLHKDHSVALPARGSHSVIQRKRSKEGDKKIKNRVLKNKGRERLSRRVTWRGLRSFAYAHSVCPSLVQPVLGLKDRTV